MQYLTQKGQDAGPDPEYPNTGGHRMPMALAARGESMRGVSPSHLRGYGGSPPGKFGKS